MNKIRNLSSESKPSSATIRARNAMSVSDRFHSFREYVERGQAVLRAAGCGTAAALWFTLWNHEDRRTGLVRVGAARLAQEFFGANGDRRNVSRSLAELEAHGFVTVVCPGKPGRGSCAVYRLHSVPKEMRRHDPISDAADRAEKASPVPGKGVVVTQVQSTATQYSSAASGDASPQPASLDATRAAGTVPLAEGSPGELVRSLLLAAPGNRLADRVLRKALAENGLRVSGDIGDLKIPPRDRREALWLEPQLDAKGDIDSYTLLIEPADDDESTNLSYDAPEFRCARELRKKPSDLLPLACLLSAYPDKREKCYLLEDQFREMGAHSPSAQDVQDSPWFVVTGAGMWELTAAGERAVKEFRTHAGAHPPAWVQAVIHEFVESDAGPRASFDHAAIDALNDYPDFQDIVHLAVQPWFIVRLDDETVRLSASGKAMATRIEMGNRFLSSH